MERTTKRQSPAWERAERLAIAWTKGDADAASAEAELFPLLDRALAGIIYTRFGSSARPETLDDARQETWPRLLDRLRRYDPQRMAFRVYFYAAAHFALTDTLRETGPLTRRGLPRSGFESTVLDGETVDGGLMRDLIPSAEAEGEAVASFRELIEPLRPDQRAMLDLYYLRNWTLKEISRLFGLSESRVSQAVSAAHDQLRAAWSPVASVEALNIIHVERVPVVLRSADVARLTGVSTPTAAAWIDSGKLPGYRLPGPQSHRRVTRDAFLAFAEMRGHRLIRDAETVAKTA